MKWKDIYIDPDGYVYGSAGGETAGSPDPNGLASCHVLTKDEVEAQKKEQALYPNGGDQPPATTTSTTPDRDLGTLLAR